MIRDITKQEVIDMLKEEFEVENLDEPICVFTYEDVAMTLAHLEMNNSAYLWDVILDAIDAIEQLSAFEEVQAFTANAREAY